MGRKGIKLQSYECQYCRGWHLGKEPAVSIEIRLTDDWNDGNERLAKAGIMSKQERLDIMKLAFQAAGFTIPE